MKTRVRLFGLGRPVLMTASLLLAACNTTNTSTVTPRVPTEPDTALRTVEISGYAVAPDKSTPIANALIYIEDSVSSQPGGTELPCGTVPNATWMATCSAADGSFTMMGQVPKYAKVHINKGAFYTLRKTTFKKSGSYVKQKYALAGSPAQGAPTMSVVKGQWDSIEDILGRLGFGTLNTNGELIANTQTFDLFEKDKYEGLFIDGDKDGKADIFKYKILFWNCGFDTKTVLTEENKKILKQYVLSGGKIYASDWAYDLVEQIFPELIDFYGDDDIPADQPETSGAAKVGKSGITISAKLSPEITSWLKTVNCIDGPCVQADDTIKLDGFLAGL